MLLICRWQQHKIKSDYLLKKPSVSVKLSADAAERKDISKSITLKMQKKKEKKEKSTRLQSHPADWPPSLCWENAADPQRVFNLSLGLFSSLYMKETK